MINDAVAADSPGFGLSGAEYHAPHSGMNQRSYTHQTGLYGYVQDAIRQTVVVLGHCRLSKG
jgi:hypothetical protein